MYDERGKVAMEMNFKAGKKADRKPAGNNRTGDF